MNFCQKYIALFEFNTSACFHRKTIETVYRLLYQGEMTIKLSKLIIYFNMEFVTSITNTILTLFKHT